MRKDLAYGLTLVGLMFGVGMIATNIDEVCSYGTVMAEGEVLGTLWRVVCRPERGLRPFSLEMAIFGSDEWEVLERFAHVDEAAKFADEYLSA